MGSIDDRAMACRVCNLVCNRYEHPDGTVEWRHSRPWQDHDHEPDVVAASQCDVEATCDFCPSTVPIVATWIGEEIHNFPDPMGGVNSFSAGWAACRRCDELLARNDIKGLVARALAQAARRGPAAFDPQTLATRRAWMLRLWRRFLPTVHTREPYRRTGAVAPPPPVTPITAAKLPKVRDALSRYWREVMPVVIGDTQGPVTLPGIDVGLDDAFSVVLPDLSTQHAEQFCRRLSTSLNLAVLYWVSPEFTAMALGAAADLPDLTVYPDDLPARHGLLVWGSPVLTLQPLGDVVAISWHQVPHGVWLVGYTQPEQSIALTRPGRDIDLQKLRTATGWLVPAAPSGGVAYKTPIAIDHDDDAMLLFATLSATWLLMAQEKIAEQTPVEMERKARKAYARSHPGQNPPSVRLVDLRHRRRAAAGPPPGGQTKARVYNWQWVVKGHWKDQPYGPGRSLRKRIYIAPHWAGPDDKPFKLPTEVVNVLR